MVWCRCGHPDVSLISFTGGTATGRIVAATAAPMVPPTHHISIYRSHHSFLTMIVCGCVGWQFKKLSLELGGKNSTVVFADCDFDATVEGAMRSAFTNQGQVCLCGSRLFVEEKIYDKFVQALVAKVQAELKVGDPKTAYVLCCVVWCVCVLRASYSLLPLFVCGAA